MKNKVRNCIQSNKTRGQREGEAGRMLIKAGETHHDVLFSSELGTETLLFCRALWRPLHSRTAFTLWRHRLCVSDCVCVHREKILFGFETSVFGPTACNPAVRLDRRDSEILIRPKKLKSNMFFSGSWHRVTSQRPFSCDASRRQPLQAALTNHRRRRWELEWMLQ